MRRRAGEAASARAARGGAFTYDLLILRDLLADRGIAPEELHRYDAAIAVARNRLAKLARAAAVGLAA